MQHLSANAWVLKNIA